MVLKSAYFTLYTIWIYYKIVNRRVQLFYTEEVIKMNEAVKFLKENPVQYFATIGLDGKPKVRPFQFMLEKEGKLYFCTSNKKEIYAQMQKNPYVEITTSSSTFAWIRLSGKVVFSKDMAIKRTIIENNPLVKSIYQNAENEIFEIFYLEDAKAVIDDFSDTPTKELTL